MTAGISLWFARRRPPTRRAIPTPCGAERVSACGRWYRIGGAALCAFLAATPAMAGVRSVTLVPPPRDFGYLLGDVVAARADIVTDADTMLETASLPVPGPVSPLLEIRRVDLQTRRDGAARRWQITISYQNFFGPEAATRALVPGYRLSFAAHGAPVAAQVPGWSFLVSALRHAITPMTDAAGLSPDPPLPPAQDSAILAQLAASALVALASLLALLWTAGALPLGSGPFAVASRRLARLRRRPGADAARNAALALHRAFDATDGRAVLAQDVALFLSRHARFTPLRNDIESFFAASANMFFGAGPDADLGWLAAFGRRLRRAERRA